MPDAIKLRRPIEGAVRRGPIEALVLTRSQAGELAGLLTGQLQDTNFLAAGNISVEQPGGHGLRVFYDDATTEDLTAGAGPTIIPGTGSLIQNMACTEFRVWADATFYTFSRVIQPTTKVIQNVQFLGGAGLAFPVYPCTGPGFSLMRHLQPPVLAALRFLTNGATFTFVHHSAHVLSALGQAYAQTRLIYDDATEEVIARLDVQQQQVASAFLGCTTIQTDLGHAIFRSLSGFTLPLKTVARVQLEDSGAGELLGADVVFSCADAAFGDIYT